MRDFSKERYLIQLQQTLQRLLYVYTELKELLEKNNLQHEQQESLIEMEGKMAELQQEIERINYTLDDAKKSDKKISV